MYHMNKHPSYLVIIYKSQLGYILIDFKFPALLLSPREADTNRVGAYTWDTWSLFFSIDFGGVRYLVKLF